MKIIVTIVVVPLNKTGSLQFCVIIIQLLSTDKFYFNTYVLSGISPKETTCDCAISHQRIM